MLLWLQSWGHFKVLNSSQYLKMLLWLQFWSHFKVLESLKYRKMLLWLQFWGNFQVLGGYKSNLKTCARPSGATEYTCRTRPNNERI